MFLAAETIAYQLKDSFPSKLTGLIAEIYLFVDTNKKLTNTAVLAGCGAVEKIEKLIFARFGMNVVFAKNLHVYAPGAIIPFFGDYFREINKTQGFKIPGFGFTVKAQNELKETLTERKRMRKSLHDRQGYVDTGLAKVGGYLSDVKHYLIIDFVLYKGFGLDAEETCAVIMHELGHAFDGLEEHHRVERTNRAIFDVLSDLNDHKYEQALYTYKAEFSKQDLVDYSLEDSKHRYDFCGKLALAYLGELPSQMGHKKYDETNFENMADTFATRFGMGRQLVSALHKMHISGEVILPRTRAVLAIRYSVDLMVMAATFLIFPVWGVAVFWGIVMYMHNSEKIDMTYDFPIDRYNRIRNTVVNAMKKMDLPEDVLKDLLAQYAYISELIKGFMQPRTFAHELADIVIPSARSARYYMELQQSIENNLNNDLFVKSAQLRAV